RKGRNPKTGEKVDVPPKKIPYFKMGKELKALLNGKGSAEEAFASAAGRTGGSPRAVPRAGGVKRRCSAPSSSCCSCRCSFPLRPSPASWPPGSWGGRDRSTG